MKHENINSMVAVLGLVIAGVTAWHQFYPSVFPSSRSVAAISTIQWSINDGRFGKGPALLARISLSNLGNEPITVRGMRVKYALGSGKRKDMNCHSKEFTWAGVPWSEILRGKTLEEAVAINVAPGIPLTEVIYFESANVLSVSERGSDGIGSVFACLEIETLNPKLEIVSVRHPIGNISVSRNSVADFSIHDDARKSFTVRN